MDSTVERHAPLKKLSKKEMKLKSKPWLTPEIINLINQRNKLFRRKKRQPKNENISKLYNLYRNRTNREWEKSKKNYYKNFSQENLNNIKNTWNGIKSIININNSSSPKDFSININGKLIENPLGIATGINNFFADVDPNTEEEILVTPFDNVSPKRFLKNRIQLNFIIAHISVEEVTEIIQDTNPKKSTGAFSIPTKLLLLIADLTILPSCKIIDTSFTAGVFPDALKIVKVNLRCK